MGGMCEYETHENFRNIRDGVVDRVFHVRQQLSPRCFTQLVFRSTPAKTRTYKFRYDAHRSIPVSRRSDPLAECLQAVGCEKNRQRVGCEKDLFPIAWHYNGHTGIFVEGFGRTTRCDASLSIGFPSACCLFQCELVEIAA